MHYLVFLMERGWVPYRQLADQQFPGAYIVEFAGMHIFGMSSLAWRLYDFTLLIVSTCAFFYVTQPASYGAPIAPARRSNSWFPGLFAACLFIVIHGRDGLEQGGQRDFVMAVLLLVATAFLFSAVRRRSIWSVTLFGLLSGLAFSIKPTVLPLSAAELVFSCYVLHRRGTPYVNHLMAAALAYLVAPLIALAFVVREHALHAFVAGLRGVVPYYASLAHRPLSYILVHSVSPLLLIVYIWVALQALIHYSHRQPIDWIGDWERTTLIAAALFALSDCILQARALPYYRYPLLAFVLPLIALDLHRALQDSLLDSASRNATLRRSGVLTLSLVGLGFGAFFLAPQSAVLIHRYRWWQTEFVTSLEHDLDALGGAALSRHIQCIDSVSGCPTVLYRMRLEPVSGVLGDYMLFGSESFPIVRQMRQQFDADISQHPPNVIVVSSHLHLGDAENFTKLDRWPEFANFLATRYSLDTEWHPTHPALWWSRPELPASYRIYVLRTR